eukprot:TRINITY_DN10770_c0_g6_i1.p1 TRINITY_DN10770_c0_g6~~TRINITY_DN10770_c0_g6_i1.p1  ORF type:complete len:701 (-),score=110.27 TRINITY_DN10770_c0_g6_i1:431-2533(-)
MAVQEVLLVEPPGCMQNSVACPRCDSEKIGSFLTRFSSETTCPEEILSSVTAPILQQLAALKAQLDEVLDGQVRMTSALGDRTNSKTLRTLSVPDVIPEDLPVDDESVQSFAEPSPLHSLSRQQSPTTSSISPRAVRSAKGKIGRSRSKLSRSWSRASGARGGRAWCDRDEVQSLSRDNLSCYGDPQSHGSASPEVLSPVRKRGVRLARTASNMSKVAKEEANDRMATFNSVISEREPLSPAAPAVKRSKSNFEAFRTEEEDKEDLMALFKVAEDWALAQVKPASPWAKLREMTKGNIELVVDSVIGILIVLNAIFIGVSMDAPESHQNIVVGIDVSFSVAFILELCFKVSLHGFRRHFRGGSRWMNTFDAALILMDIVQLAIQAIYPSATSSVADLPSASIFRVVRLVRLVRILRLLRHPALQTLLMMLHGMVGGLPTLAWALLLFVSSVYIVALMLREFLGRARHEQVYEYFDSVPRSMVTTFRCSFGDCSTIQGTPIFEHVDSAYGFGFSVFYCLFAFVMSIGMFNVISAIFVQSTLMAASALKSKRKKERLQDEDLWASRIYIIVRKALDLAYPWEHEEFSLSELVEEIHDLSVETSQLEFLVADPEVKSALEDLDIDPEDNQTLADVLDVEQTGDILLIELLQGLRRLRGNPRRSDIVAVDLTCRSMQNALKSIQTQLKVLSANNGRSKGIRNTM